MFSFDLPMVVSILDPLECDNPFTRRSFPGIVQLQGYRCRVGIVGIILDLSFLAHRFFGGRNVLEPFPNMSSCAFSRVFCGGLQGGKCCCVMSSWVIAILDP